jgi:hypothetical protein
METTHPDLCEEMKKLILEFLYRGQLNELSVSYDLKIESTSPKMIALRFKKFEV